VVLPGLDQDLDAEGWDAIGVNEHEPAGAGHPQFGLKLLLERMAVARDAVIPLTQAEAARRARDRFVSEAMRPASTAERWSEPPSLFDDRPRSASGLGILEAANEREEALAIAVLLRNAAETENTVAALVTPDRGLARRVAIELRRWRIDVDDTAGRPVGKTPVGTLARLVAECALGGSAAETLLALLKHPLAGFGQSSSETRGAARNLERSALRGPRLAPGIAALRHTLEIRLREATPPEGVRPNRSEAARLLSRRKWDSALDLVSKIEAALAPLEKLADERGTVPLPVLVEAHLSALMAAAADDNGTSSLFTDEAGEALASIFEQLRASAAAGPDIQPRDYPALFSALVEPVAVRRRGGLDPRIHIWGTLEARLQSVDTVILAGLNEGTWPAHTRLDPLLSRPMREALSLDPPERRIGLAAHDFAQALGHREVWLSRADRQDGEPRVASRWLQRLTAYAGPDLMALMRKRGGEILALARSLDAPAASDPPLRPRPSPPVELRPKQLSVTRIETLIRDPYEIYAREILKLRPF
jgi:ATP-dependent helicase/nuclease subunit B